MTPRHYYITNIAPHPDQASGKYRPIPYLYDRNHYYFPYTLQQYEVLVNIFKDSRSDEMMNSGYRGCFAAQIENYIRTFCEDRGINLLWFICYDRIRLQDGWPRYDIDIPYIKQPYSLLVFDTAEDAMLFKLSW